MTILIPPAIRSAALARDITHSRNLDPYIRTKDESIGTLKKQVEFAARNRSLIGLALITCRDYGAQRDV